MSDTGSREDSGEVPAPLGPDALERVIAAHERWLASGDAAGTRANLSEQSLVGAELTGVNLEVDAA